ncbi:MAG: energy transducer TonB [Terriglobales bacterium]
MFASLPQRNAQWRWIVASTVAETVAVLALAWPAKPMFVAPAAIAYGNGGSNVTELVYMTRLGADQKAGSSAKPAESRLALSSANKRHQQRRQSAPAVSERDQAATAPARAGASYGSLLNGPATGHDVRPAVPVVFPNPEILPWQIPSGLEGSVIVEITIDDQGNVTATRVLQALGHGLEDKVVAALRNWHFRPAMMDGRPIASQQDVYFHFPS